MDERKKAVVFLVTALLLLFLAMSAEKMWANGTPSCDPRAYGTESSFLSVSFVVVS